MDSTSRQRKSLVEGRMMTCPRCKKQHDILQYVRLEVIQEYAAETTPCYKCPSCKWIFAPADEMPHDLVFKLESLVTDLTKRLETAEAS